MAVGSEQFIAGPYTGTYVVLGVAQPLGIFEGDAGLPTLEQTNQAEPIANTSLYGKIMVDAIAQGVNWTLAMTCEEYSRSGVLGAFYPWNATLGQFGTIGALYTSLAAALVLTVVAGTPAVGNPNTITANKAILSPGFATRLMYGPTLRKVPLRFQLLPYASGGNSVWFVQA